MNDIGIVGFGVVGKSIYNFMNSIIKDSVCILYDPMLGLNSSSKDEVNNCKFTLICVPTPVTEDGHCNTSIVEECVNWIESEYIIIRSTIEPGTTERLRKLTNKKIIFQPEYIGETVSHPLLDHKMQNFIILGGPIEETSVIAEMYKRFYHSEIRFYFTSSTCAELTKYMENSFFAVKVTFCNEFFSIAKAFGVDYNELRETWLADPRINRDHTFVYKNSRGYSGRCLPKDLSAIIAVSNDKGFQPQFLESMMEINKEYRKDDPTYGPFRKINYKLFKK
jgi:UDPglucose 6-dehydrogenase